MSRHADQVRIRQAQHGCNVGCAGHVGVHGVIALHPKRAVHRSAIRAADLQINGADGQAEAERACSLRGRQYAGLDQHRARRHGGMAGKGLQIATASEQVHLPVEACAIPLQKHGVLVAEFPGDAAHLGVHQAFGAGKDEDGRALIRRIAEGIHTVKFQAHLSFLQVASSDLKSSRSGLIRQ